jgi:4-amino-4-deoxy-L-arabinose transferase-like glycosyltransferase
MSSEAWPVGRMGRRNAGQLAAALERAATPLVFTVVALLLWWMYGNQLILATNDEGIYLDAAERILHGQKPYLDFFGYMSPGSYWTHALAFRMFGITLAAGRILVILDAALECTLVYWLVARLAAPGPAIATTFLFFAFQTNDASRMTAQHRWDSSAIALLAIVLCTRAHIDKQRIWLAASGALMVLAAFATPSVALLGLVTLAWLAWEKELRRGAWWFLAGMLTVGLALILALHMNGILAPLARQIVWLSRNYSAVNVMPYGAIIGGYAALFDGARGPELPIRAWLVFCVALPAVLPILSLTGGTAFLLRSGQRAEPFRRLLPYLLLCMLALIAATYPRSDVEHLSYVAALPYALTGVLAYRCVRPRVRTLLALWMAVWGAAFLAMAESRPRGLEMSTPVGKIRASAEEDQTLSGVLAHVHPHDTLFVYPYKPLLYFLTQTENPTRYSYLAPGMMTSEDAGLVLADLKRKPPQWVLYMELAPTEYARVLPASAGLSLHYPDLEDWLRRKYRPSGCPPIAGYVLMQRASAGPSSE